MQLKFLEFSILNKTINSEYFKDLKIFVLT